MNIFVSSAYIKAHRRLTKKNPQLVEKIKTTLRLLQHNPVHPSLRLHKLSGKDIDQWNISVSPNLRIVFQYVVGGILLTDIGTHDEVY